ncbi:MAG: glycoside hydrolase family 5 protein, partial [Pseudolysinimonas sp.]
WRDLATRYASETVVLGYDLLNEPLPNEWQHVYAGELVELYRDLTGEIRAVDPDHLIMYEGSHWATNWSIFTEVWDDNSVLQFHKYWSSPDEASIAAFLEARDRLGLPIYMGEGGENTLEWLYAAFRMYEAQGIGWNLWPWKKIETRTSPVSIPAPAGWDRVIASIGGEPALTRDEAQRVFDDLLDAMRVEEARWQPAVVAAVTAASPASIPGWAFGYRGPGRSYSVADPRPLPGIREQDRVRLEWVHAGEHPANPFEQSDGRDYRAEEELTAVLAEGDWLEFEFTGPREVRVLDAAGADARVRVEPTERGVRVVATGPTDVHRVHPVGAEASW